MTYKDIQGWFNFDKVYDSVVARFPSGRFLEIGTWKGKSTAYLAKKVIESGKNIEIVCVDTFEDLIPEKQYIKLACELEKSLYDTFMDNMNACGVAEALTVVRATSDHFFSGLSGSDKFDFIFIDGSHEYENVKNDILNALEHVADGGVIAGHDYGNSLDVKRAVDELLPRISVYKNVWIYDTSNLK